MHFTFVPLVALFASLVSAAPSNTDSALRPRYSSHADCLCPGGIVASENLLFEVNVEDTIDDGQGHLICVYAHCEGFCDHKKDFTHEAICHYNAYSGWSEDWLNEYNDVFGHCPEHAYCDWRGKRASQTYPERVGAERKSYDPSKWSSRKRSFAAT